MHRTNRINFSEISLNVKGHSYGECPPLSLVEGSLLSFVFVA